MVFLKRFRHYFVFLKPIRDFLKLRIQFILNKLNVGHKLNLIYQPDCLETINKLLLIHKPVVVYDIGANRGDWFVTLADLDKNLEQIILFEPQKDMCEKLSKIKKRNVKSVVFNMGIGNKKEKLIIKGGTPSASFMNSLESQEQYFPNSLNKKIGESVLVDKLDDVCKKNSLKYPDLIKIDVQGFELNVLKGAVKVLSKTKYLVIELSFIDFYEGQPKLDEILSFLRNKGFVLVEIGNILRSYIEPYDILQFDAIFMNTKVK